MTNKSFAFMLLVCAFSASAQNTPSPVPGCPGIDSLGMDLPGGQNSQVYIMGFGDDGTNCSGTSSAVGATPISPGEYAYARFDADLIWEYPIDEQDYYIDLSNTLAEMPIGGRVTIVEMVAEDRLIGDIRLVKKPVPSITPWATVGGTDDHRWMIKIKWYGLTTDTYAVSKHYFDKDDLLFINQVLSSDQSSQYISLNHGEQISTNPYTNKGMNHKLHYYHMGFIETNVQLVEGDRLGFNLNWVHGPDPR